ncbi:MAG TPA: hotdog fold thioesterase [Balneolaceae bacterium]|nr:hotdog fold thioesterase [Balneolaceae bacterium]
MNKHLQAKKVVKKMMAEDAFSQWLGIEVMEVGPGYVKLQMDIRDEMNNGFQVTHGGIAYAFADSALAFASNSHGPVALALENNISYLRKVNSGDTITAVTEEVRIGRSIGVYNIVMTNQNGKKVAFFRGTVFRTKKRHF